MRDKLFKLRIALIVCSVLWPVIYLASEFIAKYRAQAGFPIPFCAVGALAFIFAAVLTFRVKRGGTDGFTKADSVFSGALFLLTVIASVFHHSIPGMVFSWIAIIASFVMFLRTASSFWGRVIVSAVAVPLVFYFAIFGMSISADALDDETVASVPSPDVERVAVVTDEHTAFLGGLVEVTVERPKNVVDLGVLRFTPIKDLTAIWCHKRSLLEDENGQVKYPAVEWQGNGVLLIDGEPFDIE